MLFLVVTIHVLISFFLILVVLLQQGQGADLSVFGGGNTQAAFGARSAANILHKLTVGGFVAFIVTTMSIGFLQQSQSGSTVMSGVEAPAAEAVETTVPAGDEVVPAEAAAAATEEADGAPAEAGEAEAIDGDGEASVVEDGEGAPDAGQ